MTRNELEQITKWLEANANASKFRNVYEMLERFKLEFNHLLKEEQTFNSGVWATIQCLAIDHKMPIIASSVANDMRITKKEAMELQAQSGYYDELMDEVIDFLND
jgi:hypothetical protein